MFAIKQVMKGAVAAGAIATGVAMAAPVDAASFNFTAEFGNSFISGMFEGTETATGSGVFSVDMLQMLSLTQGGNEVVLWDSSNANGMPLDLGDVPVDRLFPSVVSFSESDINLDFCVVVCVVSNDGAFQFFIRPDGLSGIGLASDLVGAGFVEEQSLLTNWELSEKAIPPQPEPEPTSTPEPAPTSTPEPATVLSLLALGFGTLATKRKLAASRNA